MGFIMRKYLIILIIFITVHSGLLFAYNRPGSTAAQFLLIGVSPRAMAMSNAFISTTDGAEATYYNPAATANFNKTEFVITHTQWFANINNDFVAVSHNFGRIGALGLLFTSFITDEMKVRTPLQPEGTGETFYSGSYRIGTTYALRMTNHVSFGTSLNYIYSSLYKDFNENAYSVDIAVLYKTNFKNFNFGMKIEHFGSEVKFINEAYPLPTNFQFGMSVDAINTDNYKLLLTSVAMKPNDGDPVGGLGTELAWNDVIFLRGGYRINDKVRTFSLGGGVLLKISNNNFHFDYSYNNFRLLGGIHSIGISAGI